MPDQMQGRVRYLNPLHIQLHSLHVLVPLNIWDKLQQSLDTKSVADKRAQAQPHPSRQGQSRVAILDASSFIFRYHHGFNSPGGRQRRLRSPVDGHDTSIQHSFLTFVLALLQDSSPAQALHNMPWGSIDHVIVVFDGGGRKGAPTDERKVTYRKILQSTYKARHTNCPYSHVCL
jgi:hypothetical protein